MSRRVPAVLAPVMDGRQHHRIARTIVGLAAVAVAVGSALALGPAANAATAGATHNAWCSQHYRSYNARTDTYLGFDGITHRCASPFTNGRVRTFGQATPFAAAPSSSNRTEARNPNGNGSGTSFRLYPFDEEGQNNGTNAGY
jgi:hypothetical protein